MASISLADILGLRPLDRVLVNDQRAWNELCLDRQMGAPGDLPYLFFQRTLDDGRVELRSPSGTPVNVHPKDICDVIEGERTTVTAMTREGFLAYLKLSEVERAKELNPKWYARASVLYAMRDRWGRSDLYVWFDEPELNDSRPWRAIQPRGVSLPQERVRRTRMPVIAKAGGAASADNGVASAERKVRAVVTLFFTAAMSDEKSVVKRLQSVDVRRSRRATVMQAAPATS